MNTKTLLYTGLAAIALMGAAGCKKKQVDGQPSMKEPASGYSTEYFTNNGKIGAVPIYYHEGGRSIALGDMDSDGDLDIVLVNDQGNVYIIENKLPQKSYVKPEAEEGRQ